MARRGMVFGLLCVLMVGGAASCGPSEPIVETAAADINLSGSDLGTGWSMQQELTMDEIFDDAPRHALDANQRTFSSQEVLGKVLVCQVFSTKSVASAQREMQGDLVEAMTTAFEQQASGGAMEEMDAPELGDEALMLGGSGSVSDVAMDAYVVALREANVFALVFLMGPTGSATAEDAIEYARTVDLRLP